MAITLLKWFLTPEIFDLFCLGQPSLNKTRFPQQGLAITNVPVDVVSSEWRVMRIGK